MTILDSNNDENFNYLLLVNNSSYTLTNFNLKTLTLMES